MAIRKIKLPGVTTPYDIGVLSSNVIYDGDTGVTTTLNSKIQSIFTAIGDINSFEIALVNALPTENIDDHTIYFVPNSQDANTRDEYMYVDNQWEMIGSTTIDLSDYPTYDDITITQGLTTGIPAATITVGSTTTTIYSVDANALTSTLDNRYVNVTGDTMTGNLTISKVSPQITLTDSNADTARDVKISTSIENVQGEYTAYLSIDKKTLINGPVLVGNKGLTPTTDNQLTSKQYVDSKVSNISYPVTSVNGLTGSVTIPIPTITATQALTTGITIGSIDVSGTTTTFYAPESKDPVYYVEIAIQPDPENEGEFIGSFVNDDIFASIKERIENGENVKVNASGVILDLNSYDNQNLYFSVTNSVAIVSIEIDSLNNIYAYQEVFSPVAFSGDYNDLINTPTPSSVTVAQGITSGLEIGTITVDGNTTTFYFDQANWETIDGNSPSYIWNKPPVWRSNEYKVPSGQTYGDSNTKVDGAIITNRSDNSAKGDYSWTEGVNTVGNHTINVNGTAITIPYGSSGNFSHTEGYSNSAAGNSSHVEGDSNVAYGLASHAEGMNVIAYGYYSHAENAGTKALGNYSHAEGYYTTASGLASHAEGDNTISQRKSQHVFGEFNSIDTTGQTTTRGTYVEIVGNGSAESSRSNARTLDWSGNEWLAGKLTIGATPTADMDVTTKQYVDTVVAGASGKSYTLSMTGATITLLADNIAASTITLPIYDGTVI